MGIKRRFTLYFLDIEGEGFWAYISLMSMILVSCVAGFSQGHVWPRMMSSDAIKCSTTSIFPDHRASHGWHLSCGMKSELVRLSKTCVRLDRVYPGCHESTQMHLPEWPQRACNREKGELLTYGPISYLALPNHAHTKCHSPHSGSPVDSVDVCACCVCGP